MAEDDTPDPRYVPIPYPYGVQAAADGLGGVAAPMLAGFAVALLGLVLQVERDLRWAGLSLLLFAAAAVLFLQVVQFHARARAFASSPKQALDWYDDADDPERVRRVRAELRQHDAAWRFWIRRARLCYNAGVVVLLCGSAVILVPARNESFGVFRIAAIVVVLAGAFYETLTMINGWLGRLDRLPLSGRWRRALETVAPSRPPDQSR
jgi:hypothetical protein